MTEQLEPIERCCSQHADWQILTDHLCRDFPDVGAEQVMRNVLDVRSVTNRFGLAQTEALDVGGLIVRYRLLVTTGAIPDVARTDPQTHHVGGSPDLTADPAERDTSLRV